MRAAERNLQFKGAQCECPGCDRPRKTYGIYCASHSKRSQFFGSPTQKAVSLKADYWHEYDLVEAMVHANIKHKGIQAGIEFFRSWMVYAVDNLKQVPARGALLTLSENKEDPLKLLIECAAIYLFSRWNPRRLPEERPVTYAYGRLILKKGGKLYKKRVHYLSGKTQYNPVKGTDVRTTGEYIAKNLSLLFLNIAEAVEAKEATKEEDKKALSQPLTIPLI